MCTISGVISLSTKRKDNIDKRNIEEFANITRKGENRGKDGIGVYSNVSGILSYKPYQYFSKNNSNISYLDYINHNASEEQIDKFGYDTFLAKTILYGLKTVASIQYVEDKGTFKDLSLLFSHNRAIPESEKQNDSTQPIESENYILIHNGIIANDEEILGKNHKKIDSTAIIKVLEGYKDISLKEAFKNGINEIQGSYALAIYKKDTKEIILATNFQPLSYKIQDNKIFFSSLREYLEKGDFVEDSLIQNLEGYSYIYIDQKKGTIEKESIRSQIKENRGLVLASGGLDTCVVAGIMKKDYKCKKLTFLHFDYGHKVEEKEQKALEEIVQSFGAKYVSVKLDFLNELFKDSPLLSGQIDESGKGLELNLEYVPVRNLILLSLATSYAEVQGYNLIGFGGNLSESMAYPDTTANFISNLNDLLPNAIGVGKNIKVIDPLKDLLKHEVVSEGVRVKAPMNLSWSCYQDTNNGKHCGNCASCRLRAEGMRRNNLNIEGL